MGMRITQNMLNQNMLYNLQKTTQTIANQQQQLSSGKKVSKPSDDPIGAVRAMAYQNSLDEIQQFKNNAQQGEDFMNGTDSALNEVDQVLQRVRELTVQGSNGTNDQTSLNSIADEIDQLKDHLGEVANTEVSGKYVFAGTDTQNPPYDTTTKTFTNTNTEKVEWQVGKSTQVAINVNGTDVFNYKGTDGNGNNVFQLLSNISSTLRSGSNPTNYISEIDQQVDNVNAQRSDLGARINRMDLTLSRLGDMETSTTNMLSNVQDADIAQVITQLQTAQSVQQAALSAGARIIQPSLVDFLK